MWVLIKRLFFLFLIITVIYQQWHINRLSHGISEVATQVTKKSQDDSQGLVGALINAESHAQKAKTLMAQGKIQEAQEELDTALKDVQSANNASRAIVGSTSQFIKNTTNQTLSFFEQIKTDVQNLLNRNKKKND